MRRVRPRAARSAMATARRVIPLRARLSIVAWLGRHAWAPKRGRLSIELLRDFAERDPTACHRFLWANHLAYAETYEVAGRFGAERINETRHLLFEDLGRYLTGIGVDPETDIGSVFEVGCSLGYLLRHLETGLFQGATTLEGIDIDRYAIEQGSTHLAAIGSKVHLTTADMGELDAILAGRTIDVILCAGTLLYLPEDEARAVVRSIVEHAGVVAVFAGLAHPDQDNSSLAASTVRERDATFTHDLDGMVRDGGGQVVWRRWEGPRVVDGNTVYFVFARRLPPAPTP